MTMTGTIDGVQYSPGSGLATLIVDGTAYHADAGPLFRALSAAYPGDPRGEMIEFDVDDAFGLLVGFTPIDDDEWVS